MKRRGLSHCIHFYETVNGKGLAVNGEINTSALGKYKKITQTTKNRYGIIEKFKESGGHLLTCKTISYGIDIKECNAVFLAYVSNSVPDTV